MQKETLHPLILGLHVAQNKFVTKVLLIFHKSLMIPAIPAEWPMYMDMIQKLPMFVSYIVVVLYTFVASLNHILTCDFNLVLRVVAEVRL